MKRLSAYLPPSARVVILPAYRWLLKTAARLRYKHKKRDELHTYWSTANDAWNAPHLYLEGAERSQFLVALLQRHAKPGARVLEIGTNVGRNLAHLHSAGYEVLSGIEINSDAVALMRQEFPQLAGATIYNTAVEDVIKTFESCSFDVVYSMAVLEHIHTDSEWVFAEMARITRGILVTIEDEEEYGERHFPRNYQRVFEEVGLRQIHAERCGEVPGLSDYFMARVFTHSQ